MKKLLFIISVFVLFFSCEKDEPCNCTKTTYFYKYETNGSKTKKVTDFQDVGCTDEVEETEIEQDPNEVNIVTYFDVKCN